MDVYRTLNAIPNIPDSVVTIGTFDGCHRGHQEIIKKVKSVAELKRAKSVLITFDPHPRHVLDSGAKLPLLMHIEKKLEILNSLHLDMVLVIPFDKEFSKIKAADFLTDIVVIIFIHLTLLLDTITILVLNGKDPPNFLKILPKKMVFPLILLSLFPMKLLTFPVLISDN